MSRRGLAALVAALSIIAGACSYETRQLPPVLPTPSENSTIFARDGSVITTLQAQENRENLPIEDMPSHLLDAVIAIEDSRFYEHDGLDIRAVFRAARANAQAGGIAEGGSTITQQYVKNVYLDDERTVSRKIEEASLALQLERTYTKDLILELYLNTIYFGRGRYGVQAASLEYFGKPATDLRLEESALLAGLIQSPSEVDPFIKDQEAISRRNVVLDRMHQLEMIDTVTYDTARTSRLTLFSGEHGPAIPLGQEYVAAHFVEEVKQWIINDPRFGDNRTERINLLFGGGLRIHTTIDLELQAQAEAAVAAVLPDPGGPDAALVTIHPPTGQILAMVGGRDYWGETSYARYNLAAGKGRQSGSSFKPLVLAAALQDGMPIVSTYSGPQRIWIRRDDAPTWSVKGGCGLVTLVQATVASCNTVYAQLVMDVGAKEAVDFAHDLGVASPLQDNEAAVLGTNDVTTVDMASAFGTFANRGAAVPPTYVNRIVRSDGTVLYDHAVVSTQVLDPEIADAVNWTLEQVVRRGTGTRARLSDRTAAGKTGTTENSWDAWFVGYTPQRATAVWVGFPEEPIPMRPPNTPFTVYGGTYPADIWARVMTDAHRDLPPEEFPDPTPEVFVGIGSDQEFLDNKHVPNVLGLEVDKAVVELVKDGYLAEILWRDVEEPEYEVEDPTLLLIETNEDGEEEVVDLKIPYGVVLAQWPKVDSVAPVGTRIVIEIARQDPTPEDQEDPDEDPDDDPDEDPDVPEPAASEPGSDPGVEIVLDTIADFYNLIVTDTDDTPDVVLSPEDEAVG